MYLRCFPPVRAEEQVDDVIVHLDLALEVRVDHLANWRRAVLRKGKAHVSEPVRPPGTPPSTQWLLSWIVRQAHTREPHHLNLAAELDEPLLEQLDLRRLAAAVETL